MVLLQIVGVLMKFEVAKIACYDTVFLRHTRGATALRKKSTLEEILQYEKGYSEILIEPAAGITTDELINMLSKELSDNSLVISKVVNETQIVVDAR